MGVLCMSYALKSRLLLLLGVCNGFLADVFIPLVKRTTTRIVFLCDWDGVIGDQKSAAGQFFAALDTVPVRTWVPIIWKHHRLLIKTIWKSQGDDQQLKGLAANLDYFIALEPSLQRYRAKLMHRLNEATPRYDMIQFLHTIRANGIPLIIATNNDYESLLIKTKKLNMHLAKKGMTAFTYDGAFCGGSSPQIVGDKAPNGLPAGCVARGKDVPEYFEKSFAFVETALCYDRTNTLFVFIDDNKKNIDLARTVAHQEGVALCAVYRNHRDPLIMQELCNTMPQLNCHMG